MLLIGPSLVYMLLSDCDTLAVTTDDLSIIWWGRWQLDFLWTKLSTSVGGAKPVATQVCVCVCVRSLFLNNMKSKQQVQL